MDDARAADRAAEGRGPDAGAPEPGALERVDSVAVEETDSERRRRVGASVINAVFVYADGTVGYMALPMKFAPPCWRRPKPRPVRVGAECVPSDRVTFDYEEFKQLGKMFDGRPVYCAERYDVKEAYMELITPNHDLDIAHVDNQLQSEMDRFLKQKFGRHLEGVFGLDSWLGDVPWSHHERAEKESQCLRKRGMRVLVAVRKW